MNEHKTIISFIQSSEYQNVIYIWQLDLYRIHEANW